MHGGLEQPPNKKLNQMGLTESADEGTTMKLLETDRPPPPATAQPATPFRCPRSSGVLA
eukprot:m.106143 g.106143  ORF g.106143 m.106143 type:complete len:59 (-) comp51673_c0_seq19:504-680(-)